MTTTTANLVFSPTSAIDLTGSAHTGATWIAQAWHTLSHAYSVKAERRALSRLTNEQLHDIGLTRSDVVREARRSVFDLPSRNRR